MGLFEGERVYVLRHINRGHCRDRRASWNGPTTSLLRLRNCAEFFQRHNAHRRVDNLRVFSSEEVKKFTLSKVYVGLTYSTDGGLHSEQLAGGTLSVDNRR